MGLLAPGFLAAFTLLGLPLWLHLLKRHKSTPLEFSSLMLFQRHVISSVKSRKLDYLLLLALRLGVLALLALAFAQPFLERSGAAAGSGPLKLFVVDVSASMGAANRMERARNEALQAIANLKPGERGQVALFDRQLHLVSQLVADPEALRAAVRGAQAGDERSSYGELCKALRGYATTAKAPVEAHLFSDMQRSALPDGFSELNLGAGTRLVLHKAGEKAEPNFTVESVQAPRRLQDPAKARVEAIVAGFDNEAAAVPVSLVVNGKVAATKSVNVPAKGKAKVEFIGLDAPYGWARCEVRVEGRDALPADDRFFFAFERSDPRKILFLYGPRSQRSVLYFQSALGAAAEASFVVAPQPSGQAPEINPAAIAFVVLSDAGDLNPAFETALTAYVKGGGSVWVALGTTAAASRKIPVSGEAITGSRYASRTDERFFALASADETHPALRRAGRWEGVRFFQAVATEPGASKVIARLNDGTPVLLEKRIGEGRVLVFASDFDNTANDFPLHASFVPFVEQTARYLAGEEDRAPLLIAGTAFELRAPGSRVSSVEVMAPDGTRALGLEESARVPAVVVEHRGFYEVNRGAGRQELVPVNIDRRESNLALIPEESLALWQGSGGTGGPGAAPDAAVESAARRQNLGLALLWAALALAVVESLWSSRHLSLTKEAV